MTSLALHGTKRVPKKSLERASLSQIGVIIPTYNAGKSWQDLQVALDRQGIEKSQILVIDSSSSDSTQNQVKQSGYRLVTIPKEEFGHGRTRQVARQYLPSATIFIYMTQDAIPQLGSFEHLCSAFSDPLVGAAFGRQLPRKQADPIERHARLFNYPATSDVRNFASRDRLGIKAAFLSNTFAAYRRSALDDVGGFPADVIIAEDTIVAARLLMAGWKVAYQADAAVIHSHAMTLSDEFARYFDTGVHHARENWLLAKFGHAGQEGRRFVLSELHYLKMTSPFSIPQAILRTANKWLAYQLGRREQYLPLFMKRAFSGHPDFWNDNSG
jgi:rhamnosyltransferase